MRKKVIILLLTLLFAVPLQGQNRGTGPKEPSAKEEMSIRRQQRRESKERRRLEKAEKKKIKAHHKRIQTNKVQKRMKKSRQTADRHNANRREFFVKRWFNKKGKPAKK